MRPLLLFKTGWYRLLLGVEGELLRHLDIPRNVHLRRRRLLPRSGFIQVVCRSRRRRSNSSGKSSQERLTRSTVISTYASDERVIGACEVRCWRWLFGNDIPISHPLTGGSSRGVQDRFRRLTKKNGQILRPVFRASGFRGYYKPYTLNVSRDPENFCTTMAL